MVEVIIMNGQKNFSSISQLALKKIKKFIRYSLPPFNSSIPYSFFQPSFNGLNISDFFLFRCDDYETIFVAENSLALLHAESLPCRHKFYFFNSFGISCGFFEVEDNDFHFNLKITKDIVSNEKIGSFIHQTTYSNSILNEFKLDNLDPIIFHHRGYTGYRKLNDESLIFSYVHGNFGGMFVNDKNLVKSLSRQSKTHSYTPQIIINPASSYDFFLNNPTDRNLFIKIVLIDNKNKIVNEEKLTINPFGSFCFNLDKSSIKQDLNISWETNLPIGRAIIFEYNEFSFDVFHS